MKRRILLIRLLTPFFLLFLLATTSFAEDFLVVHAINSEGEWQKGEITSREVVFTRQVKAVSEINVDILSYGKYQLLAYAHHNWRKYAPCIYIEAVDSKGQIHKGEACIENCWYFKEKEPGRWFLVSFLKNEPYWVLPKGKLKIKFWIDAKKGIWDETAVNPEGDVSIESLFLFPVLEEGSKFFLSGMLYPETGEGNRRLLEYHPQYGTGLIMSDKPATLSAFKVSIPVSGHYQGWISLLADAGGLLKIWIKKPKFRRLITVILEKNKNWNLIHFKPLYLEKGEYTVSFSNYKAGVLIDYFLLLPTYSQ